EVGRGGGARVPVRERLPRRDEVLRPRVVEVRAEHATAEVGVLAEQIGRRLVLVVLVALARVDDEIVLLHLREVAVQRRGRRGCAGRRAAVAVVEDDRRGAGGGAT